MPGEGSLAHHGMLFLDARPASRRHGLAGRRQPLEEGVTRRQFSRHPGPHRSGGAGDTEDHPSGMKALWSDAAHRVRCTATNYYVCTPHVTTGKAPIEVILPKARCMPRYDLIITA
jgi:hypothetical protein